MKQDNSRRVKNKTVVFRVSDEELKLITGMADVSGMLRQEYLLKRALKQSINVYPNPRMYKALKNNMQDILSELERIESGGEIDENRLRFISYIANVMKQLKEDEYERGK